MTDYIKTGAATSVAKASACAMIISDEQLDSERIEAAMRSYGAGFGGGHGASKHVEADRRKTPASDLPPLLAQTPISECGLPARMGNAAERRGLSTVADLVANLDAIAATGGIGAGTLEETGEILKSRSFEPVFEVGPEALEVLCGISGSDEYFFDVLGGLCRVPDVSRGESCAAKLLAEAGGDVAAMGIEVLGLSEPLERRLRSRGVLTVGDVLSAGREGLQRIRCIGPGKAEEAVGAAERLVGSLDRAEEPAEEPVPPSEEAQATCSMALGALFVKGYPVAADAFEAVVSRLGGIHPVSVDSIVATIEGCSQLEAACGAVLASKVDLAVSEASAGILPEPIQVGPGPAWAAAAERLVGSRADIAFDLASRTVSLLVPSIDEWVASLSENEASVVRMRLAGLSLGDISERRGVTRQRAQQLLSKAMARRPLLAEDAFRPLHERYALKMSEFCDATGEPASTHRYLVEAYGRGGSLPMKKALVDTQVPDAAKAGIRRLLDRDYLYVDGERIHRDRESVLEFLVRKHATDAYIGRVELHRLYLGFMREHGMEHLIATGDAKEPSFVGYLQRRPFVLYAPAGQGRGAVRCYDLEGRDFTELKRFVLGIGYEDVEISATLIFERPDAAEVMARYDVRDGYELYALLKPAFDGDRRVGFERAPHLNFGQADRGRQMLDLLSEVGPVDADGFAAAYRERYGVREDTFKANFLKLAASCQTRGVYSAKREALTAEQRAFLGAELSGDLMSVELVRSRFRAAFPDAPTALTGPGAAAEFGYTLDGNLLVREGVDLGAICAERIASKPLFKKGDSGFEAAVFESGAFKSELAKALRAMDVLECGRDEYASVGCLAALEEPVTKEELQDYVERALAFMALDEPYTVGRLRAEGFSHSLDRLERDLGMGDRTFAALICLACVGGRLRRAAWKDDIFFWKGSKPLSMPIVAEWAMEGRGGCTVADLCDAIEGRLGFAPSEYEMRGVLRRTDLVFKEDISMVFENKKAYEDKVKEALGA